MQSVVLVPMIFFGASRLMRLNWEAWLARPSRETPDAGDDHAADVIFLAVHNGCRRGGAKIEDDQRNRIFMDGCYSADDEVGTGNCRVVRQDV